MSCWQSDKEIYNSYFVKSIYEVEYEINTVGPAHSMCWDLFSYNHQPNILMKTTITENNLRFGGNVPPKLRAEHIRMRATAAFQTIITPFLIERLGEDSVAKMVGGTIFKITIHDVELSRDQLENTAGAGIRAGIGNVAHGRIPFRRIAYDGYVFTFLLNQSILEVDELHWQLTVNDGDRKTRVDTVDTVMQPPPLPPLPKQVVKIERSIASIPQPPPKPAPVPEHVATPTPTVVATTPPVTLTPLPKVETPASRAGNIQERITPQELHELIPILEKLMRRMSA